MKKLMIVSALVGITAFACYAFDGASVGNAYTARTVTTLGAAAGVTFPTAVASNANRRSILISRAQSACTNIVFSLSTVASATLCTAGSNLVTFAVGTASVNTNGGIEWPVKLRAEDFGVGAFYINAPTGEIFNIIETGRSSGNNE